MRSTTMTAGKLRKLLENVPPETMIMVPGSDHSYRPVIRADEEKAGFDADQNHYSEWFDPESNEGETIVNIVVLE